ncbi:hypothetical protein AAVH_21472, partial [Aphelenchoides avenae]
ALVPFLAVVNVLLCLVFCNYAMFNHCTMTIAHIAYMRVLHSVGDGAQPAGHDHRRTTQSSIRLLPTPSLLICADKQAKGIDTTI